MKKPIPNGYHDLPAGKIASVVTYLEMKRRPRGLDPAAAENLRPLAGGPPAYKRLFLAIGRHYLWFSRAVMTPAQRAERLRDPDYEVCEFLHQGRVAGLCELHREPDGVVEVSLLGLLPDAVGTGAGAALMAACLAAAWRPGTKRVWLHTCTLDHPRALAYYIRSGFKAYKRGLEIADDPRLTGKLPRSSAPNVPVI
jgi:N-acetylglutamate synthase-like GNAT family acetyltransferase